MPAYQRFAPLLAAGVVVADGIEGGKVISGKGAISSSGGGLGRGGQAGRGVVLQAPSSRQHNALAVMLAIGFKIALQGLDVFVVLQLQPLLLLGQAGQPGLPLPLLAQLSLFRLALGALLSGLEAEQKGQQQAGQRQEELVHERAVASRKR
ncbi:hypothetical protein PWG14_22695 (plasmid) [Chromobacterium amazonense]|uniref:hypothetical protein n=1 Tax=Chromobacterium amazonense TaxID=1382803 RepID=UPI00237E906F|nr:hypothetical protein [Chromobacterium amazonense]MDE1715273.1 hypothetical protein [Chromobacterium amazonense]